MRGLAGKQWISSMYNIQCIILCVAAILTIGPGAGDLAAQEEMTLVTATRFVAARGADQSARGLFETARLPLSRFNATDHCIDTAALQAATEYFDALGRELIEAGHFYFVPDEEMQRVAALCERSEGGAPQAWKAGEVKVVAFGRVVPTTMASRLEQSLR
jgi:hypothetical protein